MSRITLLLICLTLSFTAQSASLKEHNLTKVLQQVAQKSNVGTPRQINSNLLDKGYTVEKNVLINHIEVSHQQALEMRQHPKVTYLELGANVCRNKGFFSLMQQGAKLRYRFTEKGSNLLITEETFSRVDCGSH